ncbi:MAG TPA: PEP-CTERM sorting domain-containing protein [Lacipirellulaceae bacterium]|nr:PEP-CTERM sorting domain-containing protein [Lacipirellulaceae bacterium]
MMCLIVGWRQLLMTIHDRKLFSCGIGFIGLLVLICQTPAQADSTVPLSLNALTRFNNVGQSGWGGRGSFTYDGLSVTAGSLGQYGSFIVDSLNSTGGGATGGVGGSGVGWNIAVNNESPFDQLTGHWLDVTANDFPIFDRGGYGINFNPDNYKLEVVYKPLPTNEASVFNILMDTYDGFRIEDRAGAPMPGTGKRYAEQQQWGFGYGDISGNGTTGTGMEERGLTIQEYYDANPKDADGFVTISAPLTDGMGGVSEWWRFSGPSFMFANGSGAFQQQATIPGDTSPDFNDFEDLTPNGVVQFHLQSAYDDDFRARLHMDVKRISVVPINPTAGEVARLDARSGIGRRFGTPFSTQTSPDGQTSVDNAFTHEGQSVVIRETDQLQRFDQNGFTNLIINTDDDDTLGGFGTWQDHLVQTFDGEQATLEVRGRLTAPLDAEHATQIDVILNDIDGADTGPGTGGEEYKYFIDLNDFNTSTFTTVSIPLLEFDQRLQAFELVNSGDESLSDFNLYYMGVLTAQGGGLVDVELEYIRVVLPTPDLGGDFNGDGRVDAADYVVWRKNNGTTEEYNEWRSNFGASSGGSGSLVSSGGGTVPEPSTWLMALLAAGLLGLSRRT